MRRLSASALLLAAALGSANAQTLRIGTQSPFVIDPHQVFLGPDMAAAREIYDTFVGRDSDSNWVPALAVSWHMADPKTWEFKLREGVTFSDGTPFTADDVAFSLERVRTLKTPSSYLSNMRSITSWQVVDPLTIRIMTDRPNAVLPGQLTNIFIVSKKIVSAVPQDDVMSGKAAVGTGPFRVTAFTRGVSLDLVRNDRYWGPKPDWDTVHERVMTNDATRVAALLAGDIDLADDIPPTDVRRLSTETAVRVAKHPSDRVMYVQPNTLADTLPTFTDTAGAPLGKNPLRDQRVRQAISLAIDRNGLANRAFEGEAIPASQLVPPGFGAYDPKLPVLPFDPAKARQLLTEAGYPSGFGMNVACTNDRYVADEKVCQFLGQMLSRIGIKAQVETQPGSIIFSRSRPTGSPYGLMFAGQSNSASRDPTHVLSLALHSYDPQGGLGSSNRGGFSDPALDRLIDAAVSRVGEDRETALHDAMMAGIDTGATIPLYVQSVLAATRANIIYNPRMDEQTVAQNAHPKP
jgi:peptide/nickel transport system substrate-binding protein